MLSHNGESQYFLSYAFSPLWNAARARRSSRKDLWQSSAAKETAVETTGHVLISQGYTAEPKKKKKANFLIKGGKGDPFAGEIYTVETFCMLSFLLCAFSIQTKG